MYRVLPPFWLRANAGRIIVSSCASDLSIEAAEEFAVVLRDVIEAARRQESDLPDPHDDGEAERAALLPQSDRKRESAGDDDGEVA